MSQLDKVKLALDCEAWKREAQRLKQECERLEAIIAVNAKEISELRAVNRAYHRSFGPPPAMPELEPA